MDVSDLKGLFADLKKRMDGQIDSSARNSPVCGQDARRPDCSKTSTSRPMAPRCRSIKWPRCPFPSPR